MTIAPQQDGPIAAMMAGAPNLSDRPVEGWNPAHCGAIDIRIAADGSWHHEGAPIRRPELVRLFASVLRREPDGSHVLITPSEKLTIAVEDAPFVVVEVATEGESETRRFAFRLNTGEVIVAGPDHAVTFEHGRPYLHVRRGLLARIERAVFYELAELALAEGADHLTSDGVRLSLG